MTFKYKVERLLLEPNGVEEDLMKKMDETAEAGWRVHTMFYSQGTGSCFILWECHPEPKEIPELVQRLKAAEQLGPDSYSFPIIRTVGEPTKRKPWWRKW